MVAFAESYPPPASSEAGFQPLMNDEDLIRYLRLNNRPNPPEAVRNLIRRHKLPDLKRGHLRLFRRTDVDAWLASSDRPRRLRSKP